MGRFGAGLAVAALALYGVLQAVDGVGNKEVDDAWVNAANAEKAARFASALLLIAAAIMGAAGFPRPIAYSMGLSGFTYLAQGCVVGSEGFSEAHTILILVPGPHSCVDDLAGCRRLAHARFGDEPRLLGGARWEGGVPLRMPPTAHYQPSPTGDSKSISSAKRYASCPTVQHWTRS